MLHLWAREYPVSDTDEEAAISLRVAVNVCGGIGMDGLLVVMLACYCSAATRVSTPDTKTNKLESIGYILK